MDNAVENRALNAIAPENFTVAEGSIDAVAGKQFDLVLANILARPLTEMAADIVRACRPGGCLVLSGLLEIQADGVTAAYKAQGLPNRAVSSTANGPPWSGIPLNRKYS